VISPAERARRGKTAVVFEQLTGKEVVAGVARTLHAVAVVERGAPEQQAVAGQVRVALHGADGQPARHALAGRRRAEPGHRGGRRPCSFETEKERQVANRLLEILVEHREGPAGARVAVVGRALYCRYPPRPIRARAAGNRERGDIRAADVVAVAAASVGGNRAGGSGGGRLRRHVERAGRRRERDRVVEEGTLVGDDARVRSAPEELGPQDPRAGRKAKQRIRRIQPPVTRGAEGK
jgi:hypothetical protein